MRVIDLQQNARIHDRLVFLAQRIGDGEQIFLFGLVVGVALPIRHAGRRDRRHEDFLSLGAVKRRLEIVDVGLQLRRAAIGDGRGANHMVLARSHVALPVEFRKGSCFARACPWALPRHVLVDLEAAKAFVDVGDEARLAELAVIDDVDAEINLRADDLGDRGAQARGVRLRVDRLSLLPRLHDIEQIGGTRQAADVGGEDSVGASLHFSSRLLLSFPPDRHSRGADIGPHLGGDDSYENCRTYPPPRVSARSLRT